MEKELDRLLDEANTLDYRTVHIRDRIKDFRRVKASDLVPNPRNWRTHPDHQRNALRGLLASVGFVDALIARELEDGRLMLIDGHLRAETAPDAEVPVLVLDVTEAEAGVILATLDPLASQAGADAALLESLLAEVESPNSAVAGLLADLAEKAGIKPPAFSPAAEDDQGKLDELGAKDPVKCPECGHEFTP